MRALSINQKNKLQKSGTPLDSDLKQAEYLFGDSCVTQVA